jgi:lauroyl/myristoyl acyltransferase
MRYRLKHIVEYAALRAGAACVRRLPYRAALGLGWFIAAAAFWLFRFRARAAQARMRAVFGAQFTADELRRFAWLSFRNLCFTAVDAVRAATLTAREIERFDAYQPLVETIKELRRQGTGLVVAVPHMGSWELMSALLRRHDIPLFTIAGRQRNPLFQNYLHRLRAAAGNDIITRGTGTMREALRRLKAGQVMAVLPDVRMPTPDLPIRFLGQIANIGSGMAQFARHAGAPIVPLVNLRRGWTGVAFETRPPIRPDPAADKSDDARRMTQAVFDFFDQAIRAEPGQWFWFNKRWVLDPLSRTEADGAEGNGAPRSDLTRI